MKEIGDSNWLALLPRAVESPTLWLGTALLIVSFLLFAAALSWADLSFVVPAVSMEVVVNVVFAYYFLHEIISLARWTGGAIHFHRCPPRYAIRETKAQRGARRDSEE